MKRNPRKLKWTKAYRKAAAKEMTVDSTFDFEKRRNAPVKYDRNLMTATIRAMKRVSEVKAKREQRFFEKRMLVRKKHEKARNKVDISQGIDLV